MPKETPKIALFLLCQLIALSCLAQDSTLFQLASPLIKSEQVFFTDSTFVKIELAMEGVQIYYTLDGSDPDERSHFFITPVLLTESTELKAIAYHDECQPSAIVKMNFFKAQKVQLKEAALVPMAHKNYPGDGVSSLTDHRKGSIDFKDGNWLGIAKEDIEIECIFLDTIELSSVTVSTISDPNSWIFPPVGLEIWATDGSDHFIKIGDLKIDVLKEMEKPNLQFYACTFVKRNTTQLKVRIKNTNTIPPWHLRAGKGTWLFVDELIFE